MPHEPTTIIGAGPIGLAVAISARRRGIDPLVIDGGPIAASIVNYPVGMTFFTTPERLEIGGHPIVCAGAKPTRDEALMYYRGIARAEEIRVRTWTKLVNAERTGAGFTLQLQSTLHDGPVEPVSTDRLILATGYFDHPNYLGVPGEMLPHVSHYFDEAHRSAGLDVVVVGGKNSAVESALQLFRAGARVTLVYRGEALKPSVKYWLGPDLLNRAKAGEICVLFGTQVKEIGRDWVLVDTPIGEERLRADRVFALTGFAPDFALFSRLGIELDAAGRPSIDEATLETNVPGVYMAGSVIAGRAISEVFIENGRWDGEKIFGDSAARARARELYDETPRPEGE